MPMDHIEELKAQIQDHCREKEQLQQEVEYWLSQHKEVLKRVEWLERERNEKSAEVEKLKGELAKMKSEHKQFIKVLIGERVKEITQAGIAALEKQDFHDKLLELEKKILGKVEEENHMDCSVEYLKEPAESGSVVNTNFAEDSVSVDHTEESDAEKSVTMNNKAPGVPVDQPDLFDGNCAVDSTPFVLSEQMISADQNGDSMKLVGSGGREDVIVQRDNAFQEDITDEVIPGEAHDDVMNHVAKVEFTDRLDLQDQPTCDTHAAFNSSTILSELGTLENGINDEAATSARRGKRGPEKGYKMKKQHKCEVCSRVFCDNRTLVNHRRRHTGERPFKCDICDMAFSTVASHRNHRWTHTREGIHLCDICGKSFPTASRMKVHKTIHTGEKQFHCEICGKGFASPGALYGHRLVHTGERSHQCDICGLDFALKGTLQKHKASHDRVKQFICGQCGIPFTLKQYLDSHKCAAEGELICENGRISTTEAEIAKKCGSVMDQKERNRLRCVLCNAYFVRWTVLLHHMRTHSAIPVDRNLKKSYASKGLNQEGLVHDVKKLHKCELCYKVFTEAKSLSDHIRTHTGERPFRCEVCFKAFACRSTLRNHKVIHSAVRPYSCVECGKTFARNISLTLHLRTHTGEKPFQCSVCGKKFPTSSSLYTHRKIHNPEKPFKCEFCCRSFSSKFGKIKHTRAHTGERPYQCDVCGAAFSRSDGLKSHTRVHTGEKPYKCEVCDDKFAAATTLKVHMRTHTKERRYECDICGDKFTSSSSVTRHKERKHS